MTVNFPWAYTASLTNDFLGGYRCYPSPYAGASNTQAGCPGTGVPDTASNDPAPTPFPTSLELGAGDYLTGGLLASYAGTPSINRMDSPAKTPYTASYNLTAERQIGRNMIATVGYVGNFARHTWTDDQFGGAIGLANGTGGNQLSPFPSLSFYSSGWTGEQSYNALQAKLDKRLSHGISFLASYTWAHAEDSGSNNGIGGGPGSFRNENIIPEKDEFTNAVFDVRQRLTLNGYYELPFGKGKKWAHEGGLMDYVVGGWQTSLTFVAQTGNPFSVTPSYNSFNGANGAANIYAIRIGDPFKGGGTPPAGNIDMVDNGLSCPAKVKTRDHWFNPCAFTEPLSGASSAQAGSPQNGPGIPMASANTSTVVTGVNAAISYLGAKQNQIYGPGYERVNMSLFKNFHTWRAQYFQFRADAFNLLNHPTWASPGDTSLDNTAGQITNANIMQNNTPDARFFQLSGKYNF